MIKAVQAELSEAGLYRGSPDGIRGPLTDQALSEVPANEAVRRKVEDAAKKAGGTPGEVSDPRALFRDYVISRPDRQAAILLQSTLHHRGADPGPIDGDIGPRTRRAFDEVE